MKKMLFGLIATVMLSVNANAQDFTMDGFFKKSEQKSTTQDAFFQDYLKSNPKTLSNVTYNSDIVIMQLKDENLQIIDLTVVGNKYCNHVYLIFDKKVSSFTTLYMNIQKSLIEVSDSNFEPLYTITTDTGHTVLTEKKSCFRACFDKIEDTICDDMIGTIAWVTNPQLAIGAAIYCGIKC